LKKALVETYGCAQNETDSEKLRGMLHEMGYEFVNSAKDADLVLFNTCAVREGAELRVYGNIGALKHEKIRRPSMLIGVCGCMAQQEHVAAEIRRKYPHVDMVFGTHALPRFPEILEKAVAGRVFAAENEDGAITEDLPVRRDPPPLAKVPIMYGCNNFCTYCVVPYVRGRERSRQPSNVLKDLTQLATDGYKEVTLLGQNVNSYGNDLGGDVTFPQLLREAVKIDGIDRIRFVTSHPKDISDELIDILATEDKLCKALHLPVQAGSDRILKLMNRSYTAEKYLELIGKVRSKIPNIAITSDIIVGFPGETNEDFEQTLKLVEKAEFDMAFTFIYSKRRGTPAEKMDDCLTPEEKHRNFDKLIELQNKISLKKNKAYEGGTYKVLVEGESKTNPETLTGRTGTGKIVNFKGPADLICQTVDVTVTEAKTWSLAGTL